MSFIQREILRGRCREVIMAVTDTEGVPIHDAFISVWQTESAFRLGLGWIPGADLDIYLSWTDRLGGYLLVEGKASPKLAAAAEVYNVRLIPVTLAPPLTVDEITYMRVRSSMTHEWGICLSSSPAGRWHMARLRQWLLSVSEVLGQFFVYDVQAPLGGKEIDPQAFAIGGEERVQSDYLANLATVCFSVSQVTGFFYSSLEDVAGSCRRTGLLRPNQSPRRAFKVLQSLSRKEWRTRAYGMTNAQGQFMWNGFHGTYRWTITTSKGLLQGEDVLSAGATPCVWRICVPVEIG